jgi:protocatechuate 3,4-dioxygenase, alpha subunit
MSHRLTSSQTVGPFFDIGMKRLCCDDLSADGARGERIEIRGRVLDAGGEGVPDAVLEFWQADANGKYPHPEDPAAGEADPKFHGYGRVATDESGAFRLITIKPGRVSGPQGKLQGPHIAVSIFMRGLLIRLLTRIYFADDPANDADAVLFLVDQKRRGTLIAEKCAGADHCFEWNVRLQGPNETVFFEL